MEPRWFHLRLSKETLLAVEHERILRCKYRDRRLGLVRDTNLKEE